MPRGKVWGMMKPGERLKKAREAAGLSSAMAAAKKFGWPTSTYASHENGQTPEIPHDAARKYAKAFKVSAAWLMNEEGEMRVVVSRDRIERLVKSIPEDDRPAAIRYLEFLASGGNRGR
jgi:transcriptional regulator with XRE-family HTH domain